MYRERARGARHKNDRQPHPLLLNLVDSTSIQYIFEGSKFSIYCTIVKILIMLFYFSIYRQVLHLCMWNFGNKAHRALFPRTKFHIKKYDGLENIEKRSRALKVTLGHNPIEI